MLQNSDNLSDFGRIVARSSDYIQVGRNWRVLRVICTINFRDILGFKRERNFASSLR